MITVDLFQDAIVIHEVYEEGAAAKDNRLWAGDQVLEVSEEGYILDMQYINYIGNDN